MWRKTASVQQSKLLRSRKYVCVRDVTRCLSEAAKTDISVKIGKNKR